MYEIKKTTNQMTRRDAITFLMGSAMCGVLGCGLVARVAIPAAIRLLSRQKWSKILGITVSIDTGTAIVKGILNDKETEEEIKLSKEQIIAVEKGGEVTVELKNGEKVTIKPTLKK